MRKLPWGHIIFLFQKVNNLEERGWYAHKSLEEGWSRTTLELYLKRGLYQQQAIKSNKASNFLATLPSSQSGLAKDEHDNYVAISFWPDKETGLFIGRAGLIYLEMNDN